MEVSKSVLSRILFTIVYFSFLASIFAYYIVLKDTTYSSSPIIILSSFLFGTGVYIYLLIKPLAYKIYPFLLFLSSYAVLYFGGDVLGILLFFIATSLLQYFGSLKKFAVIKLILLTSILIACFISQLRFGTDIFFKSLFQIIPGTIILLILYYIYNKTHKNNQIPTNDNLDEAIKVLNLSDVDKNILHMVLNGEKYDYIASAAQMSTSGLKKRLSKLYKQLDVNSQIDFIKRFNSSKD